jgi:hypothetical protein
MASSPFGNFIERNRNNETRNDRRADSRMHVPGKDRPERDDCRLSGASSWHCYSCVLELRMLAKSGGSARRVWREAMRNLEHDHERRPYTMSSMSLLRFSLPSGKRSGWRSTSDRVRIDGTRFRYSRRASLTTSSTLRPSIAARCWMALKVSSSRFRRVASILLSF